MLKEKDMNNILTVKGKQLGLPEISRMIQSIAQSNGIELSIETNQIKKGGMINSSTVECLVLYHPSHRRDYYNFALVNDGAILALYSFGESKNQKKLKNRQVGANVFSNGLKQANQNASLGKDVGLVLTAGAFVGGIKALSGIGGSKDKQKEEDAFYSMIVELVGKL